MKWNCHIPGKANTDWDGGYFPLTMEFSEDYPAKPPKVNLRTCCTSCPDLPITGWHDEVARANGRWLWGPVHSVTERCCRAVQVQAELLPPQCLPVRHRVPQHPQ